MDRESPAPEQNAPQHQPQAAPPQSASAGAGPQTVAAAPGKDSLGKKEKLLAPFYNDMAQIAQQLAPQFKPLGLNFRPEILLATAMQEADDKDPVGNRSFDNGLGIMQITPYKGKNDPVPTIDEPIASAIGWDNKKDLEYNVQHSHWRNAHANIMAGGLELLGKAKAIKHGVPQVWDQMDEAHRWRATLYAYNAGQGAAIKALKKGGPNGRMISTFTYKGVEHSHDYTAETDAKLDYVDHHDVFAGGDHHETAATAPTTSSGATPATKKPPAAEKPAPQPAAPQQTEHPAAAAQAGGATPTTATPGTAAPGTAAPGTTSATAPATAAATPGVVNAHPGGNDALGRKENLLAPFFKDMQEVANEVAPKFLPYGLHFRPEILLATALQEAANKDPLTNRSFDNGLGIMQITPTKAGKLDETVARAIHWDNNAPLEQNIANSNWRNAKANIEAGAEVMLGKAKAIVAGAHEIWNQMDETHRWRAVLYAYNAGQGNAIKCLKAGGPNAAMISTFTNKQGERVSHDYTAEISEKLDYTDRHDAFSGESSAQAQVTEAAGPQPAGPRPQQDFLGGKMNAISATVGKGGNNRKTDVLAVQKRLLSRGVEPGGIDGIVGPHTITAIEAFQATFMAHPDGMIEPGHDTAQHLFHQNGPVDVSKRVKPAGETEHAGGTAPSKDPGVQPADPSTAPKKESQQTSEANADSIYESLSKGGFTTAIAGSTLTWHDALFLPSWGRHAKPSDFNSMSEFHDVMQNIPRQAAALQKVSNHFGGKTIHVHCWVRPPAYNKQIGGASHSAHLRGTATDFHFEGMSAEEVRKVLRADPTIYPGAGELGVSWVHLDIEHKAWFHP